MSQLECDKLEAISESDVYEDLSKFMKILKKLIELIHNIITLLLQ